MSDSEFRFRSNLSLSKYKDFRLLSQIKFGNISKKFLDKPGLQGKWRLISLALQKEKT